MTIDRADVIETEFFKHGARHYHAFGVLFETLRQLPQWRHHFEHPLADLARGGVEATTHQARQIAVERAHRRRDRHIVVVEHHDQARIVVHASIVHRLKRHTGRHRAIADHGDGEALFTFEFRGQRHAQRRRDRGGRMRGAEGVVLALVAARETGDAVQLAQRRHALTPASENFVRIGLVADIPDDAVIRCVEYVVQCNRQLHRA